MPILARVPLGVRIALVRALQSGSGFNDLAVLAVRVSVADLIDEELEGLPLFLHHME